eukprot:scaffold52748_cov60-Phaeocystis_antarctica.AAC.6
MARVRVRVRVVPLGGGDGEATVIVGQPDAMAAQSDELHAALALAPVRRRLHEHRVILGHPGRQLSKQARRRRGGAAAGRPATQCASRARSCG